MEEGKKKKDTTTLPAKSGSLSMVVLDKVRVIAEPLPADRALVRFLARVNPLVDDEVGVVIETLPAIQALVGFLARVDALVAGQARARVEALPAVRALVGLLPRVDPLVDEEGGPADEALPALRAVVPLVAGVGPLVGDEVGTAPEDFAANQAGVVRLARKEAGLQDALVQVLVGPLGIDEFAFRFLLVVPVEGFRCFSRIGRTGDAWLASSGPLPT